MPAANHHNAYDDGTLLKLQLFETYLSSWLPVFLNSPHITRINIFDFFSGPGADLTGTDGSPLRAVKIIRSHENHRQEKKICLYLNDIKKDNISTLTQKIQETAPDYLEISLKSLDYKHTWDMYADIMKARHVANFIFIDPFGILDINTIVKISKAPVTDFILFIPSQHVLRFKKTEEFNNLWPDIHSIKINSAKESTKDICEQYLRKIVDPGYKLAHFTIQKNKTKVINGIIFGSGHLRGLEKFLEVCWTIDPKNGEANFSLNGDIPSSHGQLTLPGVISTSKLRKFNTFFKEKVLDKTIKTNQDAFEFALSKGCLPRHARAVLTELKKSGLVAKTPPLSYTAIFQKGKKRSIELIK